MYYLASFDSDYSNMSENIKLVDPEHCENMFEVVKYGNTKDTYKIVKVLKNSFSKFEQDDIIEYTAGWITIQCIATGKSDINPAILFKKTDIELFSEEIDNRVDDIIKLIRNLKYDIPSKYCKLLQALELLDDA